MVKVTGRQRDREVSLTFLGHRQEIRRRLAYCVVALIFAVAVSFFFTDRIIALLEIPAARLKCTV